MHHPLVLVDSHCHLNYDILQARLESVFENARSHDVHYCMTVNTALSQTEDLIRLTQEKDRVFCSAGIHPNEVASHETLYGESFFKNDAVIKRLTAFYENPKVVGFGETGLDYYYGRDVKDLQIRSFELHIQAGVLLNAPIIIHTRDADADTLSCLKNATGSKGVFHCFSGDLALAKSALDLGYYISFSGIITFKNAQALRDIARYVPLDKILVETDSPYLTPEPHRGKSNEPAYTRFVAQKIADLKEISLQDVAYQTTSNYFQLFHKAKREAQV